MSYPYIKYSIAFIVGCLAGGSLMYIVGVKLNLANREEIADIYSVHLTLLETDKENLAKKSLSLGVRLSVIDIEKLLNSSIFATCNDRTAKLLRKNEKHLQNKALCK